MLCLDPRRETDPVADHAGPLSGGHAPPRRRGPIGGTAMQHRLSLNWTALALRGVVAIVFGIVAFLLPGLTLGALVLLFAAFAIVDGVSHVVTGIRQRSGERPDGLMILGGVVGIAVGVVAAILPGITALFLLALIGAWAIVTGAAEIFAA